MKFRKRQIGDRTLYGIARGAAFVAGGFSVIVCILLTANYLQSKALDPLNNAPLETLLQRLEDSPDDAVLREQIRTVDLLSRKALFVQQWQLRTGAYMMLGGVIVLLAALKIMDAMQQKLPMPEGVLDEQLSWRASNKSRQWIAGLGTFLLGTAFVFALFAHSELAGHDAAAMDTRPTPADFQQNWSNFRGPGGNGIAGSADAPVGWDRESGAGIKWRVAVPRPGVNSPIVWRDRVFLSGGDKTALEVYCYDAGTGELLWTGRVSGADDAGLQHFRPYPETGYAAPTMTSNGRFVYVIFANGQLACFDFDGRLIWRSDLGVPDNHYGHASSLLTHGNLLIVQYDQTSNGRLLGLDAATGGTVWRVDREVISWSSPICVNTGERMELIVTDGESVQSFDPRSGVRLWQVACLSGENGPSPAFAGGMVVVANEYSSATGIRLGPQGAEPVWEYVYELPDAASPLVTGEFVFLATSNGVIACLDAQTGEALWDHLFDDGFYASPVLAGDKVYALDTAGVMHIFAADSQFNSIADLAVGSEAFATPAIVAGHLYVRTDTKLVCIDGR